MWVIVNDKYYLSTKYEKAAEMILGYGGVYTPYIKEAKKFKTKTEALKELKRAKRANPSIELKEIK